MIRSYEIGILFLPKDQVSLLITSLICKKCAQWLQVKSIINWNDEEFQKTGTLLNKHTVGIFDYNIDLIIVSDSVFRLAS